MNLLPFVLALLLALTVVTTAKLNSLKTLMNVRAKYVLYMKEAEAQEFSRDQRKRYNKESGSDDDEETDLPIAQEEVTRNKVRAHKKINLKSLLPKSDKEKNIETYYTISTITKRLLNHLYKDQPFFQKLQEKRHDFLNELLEKISLYGKEYTGKINKITDFAKIDIHDQELSEAFAKMLEGAVISPDFIHNSLKDPEQTSRDLYPSLDDFAFIDSSVEEIRIYLASPELLLAIFNEESIVEDIIKARREHYKELKKHRNEDLTTPKQVESEKFRSTFEGRIPADLNKKLFNFDYPL
jgi:hypothetical protein